MMQLPQNFRFSKPMPCSFLIIYKFFKKLFEKNLKYSEFSDIINKIQYTKEFFMKKAQLEKLIKSRNFSNTILSAIQSRIVIPHIQISNTTSKDDNGVLRKEIVYGCLKCNHTWSCTDKPTHFTDIHCPNCDHHDSKIINNLDYPESFIPTGEIEIIFDSDIEYTNNYFIHDAYIRGCRQTSNECMILNRIELDDKTHYVIHLYNLYYVFNLKTGSKTVVCQYANKSIIFVDNEIQKIKDGKKVKSKLFEYVLNKCLFYDDSDFNEFFEQLSDDEKYELFFDDHYKNIAEFRVSHIEEVIKQRKATQLKNSNEAQTIENLINSVPRPKPFTYNDGSVYYDFLKRNDVSGLIMCEFVCPICNNKNTTELMLPCNQEVVCDHCGSKIKLVADKETQKTLNFLIIQDYNDGIIIRDYLFTVNWQNSTKLLIPVENHKSQHVIIIPKAMHKQLAITDISIFEYDSSFKIYKNKKCFDCKSYWFDVHNESTNFNIRNVEQFNHSKLTCRDTVAAYLLLCRKYPILEKILELGLTNIVIHITHSYNWQTNSSEYNLNGQNVTDVLKINDECLRIIQDVKIDNQLNTLKKLQFLYAVDNQLTNVNYAYFNKYDVDFEKLKTLCSNFELSLTQVQEYIESVRIIQCLEPNLAISIWYDYLFACSTICSDLQDGNVKYPSALRTEHDKAVYKQKIIQAVDEEKEFMKVTQECASKLSYANDDFIISCPKTIQELFEEVRKLNLQIGLYGDKIKNGNSIILFVRKTKTPNKPFFIIELNKKCTAIMHCNGNKNISPHKLKDKKMIAFLRQWAMINHIYYNID